MPDAKKTLARLDHHVARTWLITRLERALADAAERYPDIAAGAGDDPIAAFAGYVARVLPVVLIETDQPYAELLMAEVLAERGPLAEPVSQPTLLTGAFGNPRQRTESRRPLVLSFHEEHDLNRELELVHAIETSDNAVFIGCARASELPGVFHRLIDLRLKLPATSADHLAEVYQRLFGEALPPAAAGGDDRWRDFVTASDLQSALRAGYAGQRALNFLRERVNARLGNVDVADAPSLDELHGLGPARDVARDLIRDIALVLEGKIDWSEVDRGMLLVGPPGTGKTTLARAMAKDCGVKFVAASASRWQAVENQGEHLRAIRASFDEARRYQPSVLFIDEIDSIGNRELFSGHELTYQTNIVNYLLEEIDGFAGRSQIVLIAATNNENLVDPALRRAGRLDQTVHVSYPTMAALARIFDYHLKEHRAAGRVDEDVDTGALARLSFGVTGADVEFFVRGAARRARKRRDSMRQEDLVAEVLRKPRGSGHSEPYGAEVVRRLAVHEAGHATLRLLGGSRGEEIGYVSIAPRSDGRVGYIASGEDERTVMTRADYLESLRVLLAGRAAEETVFGPDGVSDLAGDYGQAGDLARATALARHLVGQTGLGGDGELLWWDAVGVNARAALDRDVERVLDGAYADTLALLADNRPLLERVADALESEQELDGSALRAMRSE